MHADDHNLAAVKRGYHRKIWPAGARALARRQYTRALRRHSRDLCRGALDLEAWDLEDDLEDAQREQWERDERADRWEDGDLCDDDGYSYPSWMDDADDRDREYHNAMADDDDECTMEEMARRTLHEDADEDY